VEVEKASVEDDRIHILNSIVGQLVDNINDVPPETHDKYEQLNNSLRATFTSSTASLVRASKEDDEGWTKMIRVMSKVTMRSDMAFDFDSDGIWGELSAVRATQLVKHIPLTIEAFTIENANYGVEFMDAVTERVAQFYNLKWLCISLVGEEEKGQ